MKPRWPTRLAALGVLAFLYAPIVMVVSWSFNAARNGTVWEGFTLRWYQALIESPEALGALRLSLGLALASTLLSTVLGTLLALGLRDRRARFLESLLPLPAFVPDVVFAAALLLLLALIERATGFSTLGFTAMLVGHVTFQLPFVTLVVRARLRDLDPALEEAARDLGASRSQTIWHITLPLLLPGVIAAALLAFTLSLDDFIVSFFTGGPGGTTLPVFIYASLKRGLSPVVHALASILVVLSVLAVAGATLLRSRNP